MVQITVSDDLARAIAEAGSLVTLVDSKGDAVAHATPIGSQAGPIGLTKEHLAELKRRMAEDDGTRYTWAEVKEHLRNLEHISPEVAVALQRREDATNGGKFFTTEEVLAHLHTLE